MKPDDAVTRIATTHAQRIKRPFGRCREASERLAAALNRNGIAARVVRCSDGVLTAPNADPRWLRLRMAPRSWVHYVVETQHGLVDLTRRQFYPEAPHPYFCSMSDLQREWHAIEAVEPMQP